VPNISAKELYFPAKEPYISLKIKLNCTQDTLLSCAEVLDRFWSKRLKFVVNVFSCERAHTQIYQANYVTWDLVVFCTCRTESLRKGLNLSSVWLLKTVNLRFTRFFFDRVLWRRQFDTIFAYIVTMYANFLLERAESNLSWIFSVSDVFELFARGLESIVSFLSWLQAN